MANSNTIAISDVLFNPTLALGGNFATTGAFNTTFVQGASVTITLPVVNGTLATLTDVANGVDGSPKSQIIHSSIWS